MMASPSSNSKEDCEDNTPKKEVGKKHIIGRELLEIQKLDASIACLQFKIEEISNELTDLQLKNREKLKQMLLSSPPECESLATNTQLFLNLHSEETSNDGGKSFNHGDVLHTSTVACEFEESSKAGHQKQELGDSIEDGSIWTKLTENCSDEKYENCETALNPYSVGENWSEFIME